jgi:hypothetical protein
MAVLSIDTRENEEDDTPASYLRRAYDKLMLDYEQVSRSFFAISRERDGTVIADATSLLVLPPFDLVYSRSEKRPGTL